MAPLRNDAVGPSDRESKTKPSPHQGDHENEPQHVSAPLCYSAVRALKRIEKPRGKVHRYASRIESCES